MGRRNVLGNQMEDSKTMWIVLLGLLISALQYILFYYTESNWAGLLLAGAVILLGAIAVHVITGEMEEIFSYLLIPCICSGGLGLLIPQLEGSILPRSNVMLLACVLSWFLPVLYACLFTWIEGSPALVRFSVFYKKAAVFFYVVYFVFLIYWSMVISRVPKNEITIQMIPFATFAAYVDGILSGMVPVERLLHFLAERVIMFLPYGFFVAMVGRKLHSLLRLGLVLILPIVTELLQYLFSVNSFDMDDMIFAFLGGMIGIVSFVVFNVVFQKTTGKNFDGSEVERDYYGRRI